MALAFYLGHDANIPRQLIDQLACSKEPQQDSMLVKLVCCTVKGPTSVLWEVQVLLITRSAWWSLGTGHQTTAQAHGCHTGALREKDNPCKFLKDYYA